MLETTVTVVAVCAPLFLLILLGLVLKRRGALSAESHRFLNWLVYNFSLPVLIFTGVAGQNFRSLLNPAVIVSTLAATAVMVAIAAVISSMLPKNHRGPFIASAYLANLTYMGFPLAQNAFGDIGLTYAGIVNAFTMPVFIVAGVLLLSIGRPGSGSVGRQIYSAIRNPVVIAALAGLLTSLIAHETAIGRAIAANTAVAIAIKIIVAVLKPIGAVGLPLSLIAVGASLRFSHVKNNQGLLWLTVAAKLVIAPLLTYLLCRWLFPGAQREAVGTAVLLMSCPVAVGLYVLAEQLGADAEFVASGLAVTTAVSCITIPVWVAIVV